eukprot:m.151726 g.151726  ORF g.151726 m.151726 type:complete len:110 (+) comp16202_c0_seq2:853-1182(+)
MTTATFLSRPTLKSIYFFTQPLWEPLAMTIRTKTKATSLKKKTSIEGWMINEEEDMWYFSGVEVVGHVGVYSLLSVLLAKQNSLHVGEYIVGCRSVIEDLLLLCVVLYN